MINKERCIHNLHQARTAHVRALNSVKLLVSGLEIDAGQFKLNLTETAFGKWFYDEAMLFSMGNSRRLIDEMEQILLSLNEHCTKVYQIYFGNKAKGISGVFGFKKRLSDAEKEFSRRHYDEMVKLSDQLKQKIRVFESQLASMDSSKFDTLANYVPVQTPTIDEPAEEEDDGSQYMYGARGH